LKQEQNILGVVAASVKQCLYAIIHIENFQKRNLLNSSQKKPKRCTYADVQGLKRLPIAMAATIARKSDGNRN
jgi:hypothetical protein